MRVIIAIFVASLALGCSTHRLDTKAVRWTKSELAGQTMALVSTNGVVETLSFESSGYVCASIGIGDRVAGPVFTWHIDERGALVLNTGERTFSVLEKLSPIKDDTVEVLRYGKSAVYRIYETGTAESVPVFWSSELEPEPGQKE